MNTSYSFSGSEINSGLIFDLSNNAFPAKIHGYRTSAEYELAKITNENSTVFGYVNAGISYLNYKGMKYPLTQGMYFTVPGSFEIAGGEGVLIEYFNYTGFFNIGGTIESEGRLKYIDGCTDSLLTYPIRKGDPCLNVLYFPKNIFQTQHTHPSYRVGIVIEGSGVCVTPQRNIPLRPGLVFVIHEEGIHSFKTTDDKMTVVSFHPDTDFGPEDENHPMINRTIIDGVSASKMPHIFTN